MLRSRPMLPFVLVAHAACGTVSGPDPEPGPQPTEACAADPAQCLYEPPRLAIELELFSVTDPDRIGGPRTLEVALRFAPDAPLPLPVVVWSHGGADGQLDATRALDRWASSAAQVGYLSVAIAHTTRDQPSREALCMALGVDAADCPTFKYLSYDRPRDIALVIDKLAEVAAEPRWAGRVDLTQLGLGGHSSGAGGALVVAGASRDLAGTATIYADPRPVAFLALSPQAPGSDGLTEAGYALVTRPTMIGTGRGDDAPPDDPADGRASVFDHLQPGNKARIFIEDPAAIHMVFALETTSCVSNATLEYCNEMLAWVRSSGLAFLDAHVRALPAAIRWIESSNLAVASAGVARWSTR